MSDQFQEPATLPCYCTQQDGSGSSEYIRAGWVWLLTPGVNWSPVSLRLSTLCSASWADTLRLVVTSCFCKSYNCFSISQEAGVISHKAVQGKWYSSAGTLCRATVTLKTEDEFHGCILATYETVWGKARHDTVYQALFGESCTIYHGGSPIIYHS